MKKFTKIITVAMMAVLGVAACFAFGACGGNGEAKIKGVYLSPAEMSYVNMRPQYNYYLTTFTQQELTLYEDGTYCLLVSSSTFSALELSESTQNAKGNERDNSVTKYYGTYTSAVNELDEDLIDIELAKPTRIVKNIDSKYFVDTANWNETMGKNTRVPSSYDPSTGNPVIDDSTPNQTADGYLKLNAFKSVSAQANTKQAMLTWVKLEVEKA